MTKTRHLAAALIVVTVLALLALQREARGDEDAPIVVVTSRDDAPYDGVVSGIQRALDDAGRGRTVKVHSLHREPEDGIDALRRARAGGGNPIITIGSVATRAALGSPGDAPVIACMVVNSLDLSGAENATGVLLDFPLKTQLEWIRRFSPKSRTIGVLYNPAENSDQIVAAKQIARRLGLKLVSRPVHRPRDLPDALDHLALEADLLWGVTDQLVLSRQTAEAILLFSFRNRIPFTGLSASWVKAGALYALDRDYEDLGAQCGEMAVKVVNGRRASSLPPVTPRKLVYSLNLRTAEHLKIRLPPDLVSGARQVFR